MAFAAAAALAVAASPGITLDVRLEAPCSGPHAGRPVTPPAGAAAPLCVERMPFLSERDIESAEIHRNAAGSPVLLVAFRADAAQRELRITKANIGKRVAISVGGRVVSAPAIPSASRLLFIDGHFSEPRAREIVDAWNRARSHE